MFKLGKRYAGGSSLKGVLGVRTRHASLVAIEHYEIDDDCNDEVGNSISGNSNREIDMSTEYLRSCLKPCASIDVCSYAAICIAKPTCKSSGSTATLSLVSSAAMAPKGKAAAKIPVLLRASNKPTQPVSEAVMPTTKPGRGKPLVSSVVEQTCALVTTAVNKATKPVNLAITAP